MHVVDAHKIKMRLHDHWRAKKAKLIEGRPSRRTAAVAAAMKCILENKLFFWLENENVIAFSVCSFFGCASNAWTILKI